MNNLVRKVFDSVLILMQDMAHEEFVQQAVAPLQGITADDALQTPIEQIERELTGIEGKRE